MLYADSLVPTPAGRGRPLSQQSDAGRGVQDCVGGAQGKTEIA